MYGQKRVEGVLANHVSPNSVFAAFKLLPTRFWPRIDRELPFLAIALFFTAVERAGARIRVPVFFLMIWELIIRSSAATTVSVECALLFRCSIREHSSWCSSKASVY